jgi:hypothetical protein
MISDLVWWTSRLEDPLFFRDIVSPGPVQDLHLYVDASTSWGIGVISGTRWLGLKLLPDWKTVGGPPHRDICWLETIAIEVLALIIEASGIRNSRLVIHSDNQGTIGAVNKGRSSNYHINTSVRRTFVTLSAIMVSPVMTYVPSAENPADPISRGSFGPSDSKLPVLFHLPDELTCAISHDH